MVNPVSTVRLRSNVARRNSGREKGLDRQNLLRGEWWEAGVGRLVEREGKLLSTSIVELTQKYLESIVL